MRLHDSDNVVNVSLFIVAAVFKTGPIDKNDIHIYIYFTYT